MTGTPAPPAPTGHAAAAVAAATRSVVCPAATPARPAAATRVACTRPKRTEGYAFGVDGGGRVVRGEHLERHRHEKGWGSKVTQGHALVATP